jgi:hypothetical protein
VKNKNVKGFKLEKQPTRIERIEKAIKELASLPNFLLQRFQTVLKVVEDLRFTYEIVGQILQDKGVITQEEITEKGNAIIAERKKAKEAELEKLKQVKEDVTNESIKNDLVNELMKPNIDLQKTQIQEKDVSIKEIK